MADKKTEKSSEVKTPPSPPASPKPLGQVRIETSNGIYIIKKPSGRIGAKHFALLTKSIPAGRDEEGRVMLSPGDQERFSQVFEEWCAFILPNIVISGPFKYEDMPGEDQYAIFLAMFETMNIGDEAGDIFRILEWYNLERQGRQYEDRVRSSMSPFGYTTIFSISVGWSRRLVKASGVWLEHIERRMAIDTREIGEIIW